MAMVKRGLQLVLTDVWVTHTQTEQNRDQLSSVEADTPKKLHRCKEILGTALTNPRWLGLLSHRTRGKIAGLRHGGLWR